jgi:hypothetical protein
VCVHGFHVRIFLDLILTHVCFHTRIVHGCSIGAKYATRFCSFVASLNSMVKKTYWNTWMPVGLAQIQQTQLAQHQWVLWDNCMPLYPNHRNIHNGFLMYACSCYSICKLMSLYMHTHTCKDYITPWCPQASNTANAMFFRYQHDLLIPNGLDGVTRPINQPTSSICMSRTFTSSLSMVFHTEQMHTMSGAICHRCRIRHMKWKVAQTVKPMSILSGSIMFAHVWQLQPF